MLRPRVIPCLLLHDEGLVKTTVFKNPRYIGDPINTVRLFNEKEVDELIILDIDATVQCREPNFRLISELAAECRMPLCYGGGITNISQARQIISLGVEKLAFGTAASETPSLISELATEIGSQSIVVVLDVKTGLFGKQQVWTHNGTKNTWSSPLEIATQSMKLGAGEVLINSIDRDGLMTGYDLKLAQKIRDAINLPITVLGGAGSLADIAELFEKCGVVGAAAGSLFVFKGDFKAVLISYPSSFEKDKLCH